MRVTVAVVALLLATLSPVGVLADRVDLLKKEQEALDQVVLYWFVDSKLSSPLQVARDDPVACIHRQIRCQAHKKLYFREFRYPWGMGSSILKPVMGLLMRASVNNLAVQIDLQGWKDYHTACPENETTPWECFFEPVCPKSGFSVSQDIKYFNGEGQQAMNKEVHLMEQRCDATYEEIVAGLMQHVQLNFELETLYGDFGLEPDEMQHMPPGSYVALHLRLGKASAEYVDKRDYHFGQSWEFWHEVLRQLAEYRGVQRVYIATDRCSFLSSIPEVEGLNRYSSCDYMVNYKHTRSKAAQEKMKFASLKMDLFRLRHATHFYADTNSNMDIIVSRMRAFKNTTLLLGGIKSKFNNLYGDDWPKPKST